MAEEFQGGVCSGTWWNPNLFSGGSGGVGGFSSPCSVAQLGGGYDMGSFGWPHEIMKGNKLNDHQVCDDNTLAFSADIDSTLDILGFGLSPTSSTTDWNHQNQFSKGGSNENNYELMLLQENLSSALNYEMGANVPTLMNSASFSSQDGSSPPTTTMSNSSGDSITSDGGRGLTTSFPMSSSASYLLQTLFDDIDESQVSVPQQQQQQQQQAMSQLINTSDYGHELMSSPCLELPQSDMFNVNGGHQLSNGQYNTATTLSNIRASLLNSLQSRSRAPTFNQKSLNTNVSTKVKHEETRKVSKKNMNNNNNDQPAAKRPRIETPSPLPTFKVRKEKLGDRITALQQLVSPFGKTDTASVLHEAIEYIKFLHDQVHVLSTPYSKNNGAAVQHQQVSNENNEEIKQDLRSRGLCLAPIASTYPVTQETPVDFWTPTFGGTTFR